MSASLLCSWVASAAAPLLARWRSLRCSRPVCSLEIAGEPVPAALAAVAGLLVAAEGRRRVELVERVGPHDAGPELIRDLQDPRALLRPDAGRQAIGAVVGLGDGLVGRAEREHAEHRAEDLVAGDAVRGG